MQVFIRRSKCARLIGAFAALWLSAGSAWAGGGGADVASIQGVLSAICSLFPAALCPELPTVSQTMLEIAALQTAPTELVRFEGGFTPTDVVNAVNSPAAATAVPLAFVSGTTATAVPLAFVNGTTATVAQTGDPDAKTFFYAVVAAGSPPMLDLVYDFTSLTTNPTGKNQSIAELTLPLVILNTGGTETEAPTTIQIQTGTGCGKTTPPTFCVAATATSTSSPPLFATVDPAKLGLTVSAAFTSSANSAAAHVIVTVQAPLLVQTVNDAAYFAPGLTNTFPTVTSAIFFKNAANGFAPSKVLASGIAIGIAPYAGPLCAGNNQCLTNTTSTPSAYPYCASIADGQAVAAFLAIGKFGETYVSAPANPLGLLPEVSCRFQ